MSDLGNAGHGIYVTGGDGLVINGNLVSGNDGYGIYLSSTGVTNATVTGNIIGLNAAGTAGLLNSNHALYLNSTSNATIGGTTVSERNVINSAGGTYAVYASGTTDTLITGNYIGTDALGTTQLSAGSFAINNVSSADTIIGGATAAHANVIGGYSVTGINISGAASAGTAVQGNYIGTDVGGTLDLTTGLYGIAIQASATGILIGGTGANAGNVIANHSTNGIRVFGSAGSTNSFLRNRIYSNGALGIDLAGDGVTNNDADDADPGVNNLQNFPQITSAVLVGTDLTLAGSLDTDGVSTEYRIEFYGNVSGTQDPTHGEGRYYLGTTTVTTDGSGDASFTGITLSGITLAVGDYVTATATRIRCILGKWAAMICWLLETLRSMRPTMPSHLTTVTRSSRLAEAMLLTPKMLARSLSMPRRQLLMPMRLTLMVAFLTINVIANGSGSDRIRINNEGMGAGQVGMTNGPNEVYYSGVLVGTWSGSGARWRLPSLRLPMRRRLKRSLRISRSESQ